jgi:hypothetical protein
MTRTAYVRHLDADVRYRVAFTIDLGRVLEFVVQLEVAVKGKWTPAIRFDTAHGLAHCDRFGPDGTVQKHQPLPVNEFNGALTYATRNIREYWEDLARPFRELNP